MQSVLNKLAQINKGRSRTKRSLSKGRNVKLSKINDLEKELEYLKPVSDEAISYGRGRFEEIEQEILDFKTDIRSEVDNAIINGETRMIPETVERINEMLSSIENSANELGISVDDLLSGTQYSYEDVKYWTKFSLEAYDEYIENYRKVVEVADGFLTDFSR